MSAKMRKNIKAGCIILVVWYVAVISYLVLELMGVIH